VAAKAAAAKPIISAGENRNGIIGQLFAGGNLKSFSKTPYVFYNLK
jgi:hypothetical protein